jgi:hypothetical protein
MMNLENQVNEMCDFTSFFICDSHEQQFNSIVLYQDDFVDLAPDPPPDYCIDLNNIPIENLLGDTEIKYENNDINISFNIERNNSELPTSSSSSISSTEKTPSKRVLKKRKLLADVAEYRDKIKRLKENISETKEEIRVLRNLLIQSCAKRWQKRVNRY